jgi:hypothetical protein
MKVERTMRTHVNMMPCSLVCVQYPAEKITRYPLVFIFAFILISTLLSSVASYGSAAPEFQTLSPLTEKIHFPTSVAADNTGRIFVANSKNNKIVIFNQQGVQIDSIQGLASPISVEADNSGNIYVGNEKKGNVEIFGPNLNFLYSLGKGDNEFVQPNDIAVDTTTGNVYIADKGRNVVGIYDGAGGFVRNLGEPGNGNGQFHSPLSVAIDINAEEIIVLDRALVKTGGGMMGSLVPGARIQFFSMEGVFLRSFDRYGGETGQLLRPQRIEVGLQSKLYVTDSSLNAVLVYDNTGNYLGAIFDADNPFRTPLGLTLDSNNKLFVASHFKKCVEVYGIDDFINMSVTPTSLIFTAKEEEKTSVAQAITLHNTGNKSYEWSAVANVDWLVLMESQGPLDIGEEGAIHVMVDATALEPGDYTGSIRIFVGTVETGVVHVALTVEKAPALFVEPPSLEFVTETGKTPNPQTVTIANRGSLPLHWSMSADRSWLVMKNITGTIPNEKAGATEVGVYPDVRELEPGTYITVITVTGDDAIASPRSITVLLTVRESIPHPVEDKSKDSDQDGTPDYIETCIMDPNKLEPGICGCGKADEDTNNNDIIDCLEVKNQKLIFPIKARDGSIIFLFM